ncbi:MAG: hypothetical protein JWO37_3927, partial [Acidimicrobiales bacterium]|nr:hypothetical protein [Acidimicrobiales bacterium]
ARERGSVLVLGLAGGARASPRPRPGPVATAWPEGVDVRLAVSRAQWEGLGQGHGRLAGRRVEVVVSGRRSATRERRAPLWLPAPGGGVAPARSFPEETTETVHDRRRERRQGAGSG